MIVKLQIVFVCAILCFAVCFASGVEASTLVVSDSAATAKQEPKGDAPKTESAASANVSTQKPSSCMPDSSAEKPVLRIAAGDMLSRKMIEWAGLYGYSLSWEIPELRADGNLTSSKGFADTLTDFKRAMEINGITFDVVVYENCVVRIVEVK